MTAPTIGDAKHRVVVRLADGRTGRLAVWPAEHSTGGRRARVILPGGAWISVDPGDVALDGDAVDGEKDLAESHEFDVEEM